MSFDFLTLFFSFLSAFIVKDFYDIFVSKYIRKFFKSVYKRRKDLYDWARDIEEKDNKKR